MVGSISLQFPTSRDAESHENNVRRRTMEEERGLKNNTVLSESNHAAWPSMQFDGTVDVMS